MKTRQEIKAEVKEAMKALLDWVYPPVCISCRTLLPLNESRRFICEPCENLFEPIITPFCEKCGAPTQVESKHCASCFGKNFIFEQNRAAFTYDELIRDLLHQMKFHNKKRVAQGLGLFWAMQFSQKDLQEDFTLVPMPMHQKKQRERGFNQAEILTAALSKKLGYPMENILIRTHDTPPQAGLHPSQRAENVKDVFAIRKNEIVEGKKIILTDDIFTTGSSLNECAKTLKNAGASKILCMTLAIAVKNTNKH
ncbi:MAG: ComF family protein [Defluviitaleaceae bacterium]|nr:ComF family protein [Defluviitaleaceae bacterium]